MTDMAVSSTAKRLDYASLGVSISPWVFSNSEMTSLASTTARRTKSWTLKSLGMSYRCFASFGAILLIILPRHGQMQRCADLVNRSLKTLVRKNRAQKRSFSCIKFWLTIFVYTVKQVGDGAQQCPQRPIPLDLHFQSAWSL